MQNVEKASASGAKPVDQLLGLPVTQHIRRARHEAAFQAKHMATPQGGRQAAWQH